MKRKHFLGTIGAGFFSTFLLPMIGSKNSADISKRPNILLCISDDQSWEHASAYGDTVVETPHFDRIAEEGVLFSHAYAAAPSCAPSRAAILTGQEMWRLEEGGLLFGALPDKFPVFPKLLEESGYSIGYTGKGYQPANHDLQDHWREPIGRAYNDIQHETPDHISSIDYAANFGAFLESQDADKPFFFWYGAREPHLAYEMGVGKRHGINPDEIDVPAFLPDIDVVRNDMSDYYFEIQWQDAQLGKMLSHLEKNNQLENTIIVVTSDNGMPFPRAKTTLCDHGVRIPLAIRWGSEVQGARTLDDFISLTDLAPTFLQAAGVDVPNQMTGMSILPVLTSNSTGKTATGRSQMVTAIERHVWARPNGEGYPRRAIRTYDWLYVRNYEPDRWPAGNPDFVASHQGVYGDIDDCPTKQYMIEHQNDPEVREKFALAFEKLPAEELYNVSQDPYQINNVASDEANREILEDLRQQLNEYLEQTGDPRAEGRAPWDEYPFYSGDYAKKSMKND
ncbi:MAG: sulfatase [Rhodothermaceae bacterium]|nr:sulfatase [Rhodothermaceae bacterium]